MRLPRLAAMFVLACAISAGGALPLAAGQSASRTPHKAASHKKKHHSKRQPTQKAPTSDRISEIQSALGRQGYYDGQPSGKMDARTLAALEKFQAASGMGATGKLDAPTLQKLGLGSDIAGVSAPKHAAPPACCSTSAPAAAPGLEGAPSASASAPGSGGTVAANTAVSTGAAKPADH